MVICFSWVNSILQIQEAPQTINYAPQTSRFAYHYHDIQIFGLVNVEQTGSSYLRPHSHTKFISRLGAVATHVSTVSLRFRVSSIGDYQSLARLNVRSMERTAVAVQAYTLPCELYGEIAWNFSDPSDRHHLLELALVDAAWLKESQRILFMSMCDGSDKLPYWTRSGCVARHTRFLKTILAYPQRLGPLVRSYAQVYLGHMDSSKHSLYMLVE